MTDIRFEITQHVGVLSESPIGRQNLISRNHADPKYDTRDWSPDHWGKGAILTNEEIEKLRDV
ncbi:MAG: hypothetical protein QMC95_13520 [Desulfitobacteriaceae bacterium]|nr:hypothetical protein [Desulfitobacteriaceae bacterium]MDI6915217.1 hypothetical protein [Desulfitobacteriaceae bacterium]